MVPGSTSCASARLPQLALRAGLINDNLSVPPAASTSSMRVPPWGAANSSNCDYNRRDAQKRRSSTLLGVLVRLVSVKKSLAYSANVKSPCQMAIKLAHAALALAEVMAACSIRSARPAKSWGRKVNAPNQSMDHSQDLAERPEYKVYRVTGKLGSGACEICMLTCTR